ncbi:MAG: BMC domain-containing protein [Veillonella sp.]|uniref:BMC domain-containing protein n=1 Tax=Veillonella sp. TaxID=1926307 RepID=UPI0025CD560F|nr:BMC domain-containing protein [Veillonella sp.]MBS4913023.1 BMC domain-containing protein [Veillonella sp.]
MDVLDNSKQRIIQELVPGKQVTMAHIIASPDEEVYQRIGVDPVGAIGVLTISPAEAAIIAGDIARKAANVHLGFLDRFTGSVVITGDVSSVETSVNAINDTLHKLLGFTPATVTRA